jgi:ubiquinone/menaquinone biosynthesis C-methylase UbiE
MVRQELVRSRAWLDVGCGHQFLPTWMPEERRQLDLRGCRSVGIDPDRESLGRHEGLDWKVCGAAERLPFADGAFDLLTANTVLEHVEHPDRFFAEASRVLSPGGRFLVHTPNAHGYTTLLTRALPSRLRSRLAGLLHERSAADVYPTFYRANTRAALQQVARKTGFSVVDLRLELTVPQLYMIPPLLVLELLLIGALTRPMLAPVRPCLLARFERRAA